MLKCIPLLCLMSLSLPGKAEELSFSSRSTGLSGRYAWSTPPSRNLSGVLVRFHGSGAAASYQKDLPELEKLAARWKLAAIVLQTPAMAETWADDGAGGSRFSSYVKELLDEKVYSPYPWLDKKRSAFVGISAGSTFILGDLIRTLTPAFGGGAILLCGGGPPMIATRPEVGALGQNFKILAYIQQSDFLFAQTQMGLSYWQGLGIKSQLEIMPGSGHCAFDLKTSLERGLAALFGTR